VKTGSTEKTNSLIRKFTSRKVLIAVVMIVPMLMSFCAILGTFVLMITGPCMYLDIVPKPDFLKWQSENAKVYPEAFKKDLTVEVNTEKTLPLQVKIISLKKNITSNLSLQTNRICRLGEELEVGKYRMELKYGDQEEFFEIEKIE
jgi:hypothetical protein